MGSLTPTSGVVWWLLAAVAHRCYRRLSAEEVLAVWFCWLLANMMQTPEPDSQGEKAERLQKIIRGHERRIGRR